MKAHSNETNNCKKKKLDVNYVTAYYYIINYRRRTYLQAAHPCPITAMQFTFFLLRRSTMQYT